MGWLLLGRYGGVGWCRTSLDTGRRRWGWTRLDSPRCRSCRRPSVEYCPRPLSPQPPPASFSRWPHVFDEWLASPRLALPARRVGWAGDGPPSWAPDDDRGGTLSDRHRTAVPSPHPLAHRRRRSPAVSPTVTKRRPRTMGVGRLAGSASVRPPSGGMTRTYASADAVSCIVASGRVGLPVIHTPGISQSPSRCCCGRRPADGSHDASSTAPHQVGESKGF